MDVLANKVHKELEWLGSTGWQSTQTKHSVNSTTGYITTQLCNHLSKGIWPRIALLWHTQFKIIIASTTMYFLAYKIYQSHRVMSNDQNNDANIKCENNYNYVSTWPTQQLAIHPSLHTFGRFLLEIFYQ